jgi:Ni/Fe-hydrogenase subunit HybB-like protein
VAKQLLTFHATGPEAWIWYTMLVCNIVIPWLTLWNKKFRRTPLAIFIVTLLINIGMYFERLTIIPFSLRTQRSPFDWGSELRPQFTDLGIVIGSFCLFIFLYLVMSRLIPLVPVWEIQEGQTAHQLRKIGKAKVKSVTELD